MTLVHACDQCRYCPECHQTPCGDGLGDNKILVSEEQGWIVSRCPYCNAVIEKFKTLEKLRQENMMTTQEFEDYLVGIGGLVSGWRTDADPILSRHFCSCGDGWLQLLHDCIEELLKAGWDKQVTQIKEKFGGLRFYIGGGTEEIHAIISKYEELSYKTCEVCGAEGRLHVDYGWYRTLCDNHHRELIETKTTNSLKSLLNSVMNSGLPVLIKNRPVRHPKYNLWDIKVFWEIPDLHVSEEFDDTLECIRDCKTYIDNMDKEDKPKPNNK